ncbi:GyrI-like domain-containing protein [Microvirga lenta]|uniref:GyrI-like domain-containing protein n=1 Tax=Microvirga lenta TaxID=2881337 RepID=UPI001CFD9DD5|nr:GyrI-like domain-containing protein [Microvirga lenta]MCB5174682.1 GyrI-like domain-containing protein [Microvirga lenta]
MRLHSTFLIALLALGSVPALAQTPPAPAAAPPAPVESSPVPPPAASPAPAAPAADQAASPQSAPPPSPQAQTPGPAPAETPATPAQPQAPATAEPAPQPAAPAAPSPSAPVTAGRTTLFPNPGDPTNVEEGVLAAKPAAVLEGRSSWEDGFTNLKSAFARIEDELKKAGIAPTGRPLTVFVHTDDTGFRYQAMVPVAQAPEGKSELTPEIKFGRTPEGKSFRFVHEDAYDEIDGTYETITAYLDAKNIESKDAFVEEYVTELTDAQDTKLKVNIYVQPKE